MIMRKRFIARASCCGRLVRYYLLVNAASGGSRMYGILIEGGGSQEKIPAITPSRRRIQSLLEQLVQGCVTPVTVRDVVEDWLLM